MEPAKEGMGAPWAWDSDEEGPSHSSSATDGVQATGSGSGEGIDCKYNSSTELEE